MATAKINIEFSLARNKARELSEAAAELRRTAEQQYSDAIEQLNAAWCSDYSNDFMIKANRLRDKMLKSAKNLDDIARSIVDSVRRMEEAERRARELARLRTFHK